MSALAEALLAAQRQAVASLGKAYVNGAVDKDTMFGVLDGIGLRDGVEQGLLLASLEVVKNLGGEAPRPTGPKPTLKVPEQATEAQVRFIAKLCDEKGAVAPDVIASKEQAHEIIEALKAGTYNADAYSVPF